MEKDFFSEENLRKMAEKSDTLTEGSLVLIEELKSLLLEAEAGEFDDFANEKYSMPKVALVEKLTEIIDKTKKGKYD